jgi:hypothetical protein
VAYTQWITHAYIQVCALAVLVSLATCLYFAVVYCHVPSIKYDVRNRRLCVSKQEFFNLIRCGAMKTCFKIPLNHSFRNLSDDRSNASSKNVHKASVNFASFVCPKVTNQPAGAFSWNFVVQNFTKFCWNMPPAFVKTGKYIGRITRVSVSISDSYVDKYLSQRKLFPTKVDSEIIKQNGGKQWRFYFIYFCYVTSTLNFRLGMRNWLKFWTKWRGIYSNP